MVGKAEEGAAFAFALPDRIPPVFSSQAYDATLLMEAQGPFPFKILVDQGEADKFLAGSCVFSLSFSALGDGK